MNEDRKHKICDGVYILNESGSSPHSATMRKQARRIVSRAIQSLRNKEIRLVGEPLKPL